MVTDIEFSPSIPIPGQPPRPCTNMMLRNQEGNRVHMVAWGEPRARTLGCLHIGAVYRFTYLLIRPIRNYASSLPYTMIFTLGSYYQLIRVSH